MKLHQPLELVQDPRRLQYGLFLGEHAHRFSRAGLTIVQEAHAGMGPYIATVAIIGESHFVSIDDRDGRAVAVELLACVDPQTCGGPPTIRRGYADIAEAHTIEAAAGGVAVVARLSQQACRDDGWVVPAPERGETAVALIHSFPSDAAPRTFVGVRIGRATGASDYPRWRLRISTIHEYVSPDRVVVVTSETVMTIGEEVRG